MHAEIGFVGCIGQVVSRFIPAILTNRLSQILSNLLVFLCLSRLIKIVVQLGCTLQRISQLHSQYRRLTVGSSTFWCASHAGCIIPGPLVGPIHKVPVFHLAQQTCFWIDTIDKPIQNLVDSRQKLLYKFRIVAQCPIIVDHIDPEERKWRNYLRIC